MPRGKYVNHKGRSRKFTSPEELQNESSSDEETSGEETQEGATGTSSVPRTKNKSKGKKATNESSSEEGSEEDSDEDNDRDAKKGVAGLIEIENPNRAVKKATQKVANISINNEGGGGGASGGSSSKPELSRREREQIEKQKQRQRYEKLHAEGKTNEAKADLARLAIIRQQRADAAAKREAEKKAVETKKSGSKE